MNPQRLGDRQVGEGRLRAPRHMAAKPMRSDYRRSRLRECREFMNCNPEIWRFLNVRREKRKKLEEESNVR